MSYQYIFPTCIFNDIILDDDTTKLLSVSKEYLEKYGKIYNHSKNHITTLNNINIDELIAHDDRFDFIREYIKTSAKEYLIHQNVNCDKYDLEPYITFNKMGPNTVLPNHSHPQCLISGIIYLQVTTFSPPIIFQDPRSYPNFNVYEQLDYKNIPCLYPVFNIKPSNGMMLMWPAWLNHEVPLNETEDERITLVFNISG